MVKGRPAKMTSAIPAASISARASPKLWATWAGSPGAPIVAIALIDGISGAAFMTAAPPRE